MKYHSLFLSKIRKDATKFVVCCSRDWHFKSKIMSNLDQLMGLIKLAYIIIVQIKWH